jgi:hypothetical protein
MRPNGDASLGEPVAARQPGGTAAPLPLASGMAYEDLRVVGYVSQLCDRVKRRGLRVQGLTPARDSADPAIQLPTTVALTLGELFVEIPINGHFRIHRHMRDDPPTSL